VRAEERPGLSGAAKLVADRARSIVRLELELAASEIKAKLTAVGVGIGMFAGAAILAVFAIGFLLAAIAAALATQVPTWLALLIVTGALLGIVALLVVLGRNSLRKGSPPVPAQAIEEAKLTVEAVKNGKH
jgi:membrane protein implicated in regulation of membrane protease activity